MKQLVYAQPKTEIELQGFKDEMKEFKNEMKVLKGKIQVFKSEMREFKDWAKMLINSSTRLK